MHSDADGPVGMFISLQQYCFDKRPTDLNTFKAFQGENKHLAAGKTSIFSDKVDFAGTVHTAADDLSLVHFPHARDFSVLLTWRWGYLWK